MTIEKELKMVEKFKDEFIEFHSDGKHKTWNHYLTWLKRNRKSINNDLVNNMLIALNRKNSLITE